MDIGIIVEDKCDIEVMNELTGKLVKSNLFSFKKNFKAHGCGKLKIKCASWAKILFERGCEHLIV
ncbi:MAG: hypothetical protein KKD07_08860, partial [Candidatus Omnitrophica bacterium]|nr:hypothetical protein [Candidatus Omnitrophota bacterium]